MSAKLQFSVLNSVQINRNPVNTSPSK